MLNESINKSCETLHILNKELKLNNEKIELLADENRTLENRIHKILNKYSSYINIFLKLGSILFIITGVGIVGTLSNFNFLIMLLFSIASPITCIFMNVYITSMLKERYRKKNNKTVSLDSLIKKNNDKITELRKTSVKLVQEILGNSKNYNHQKVMIDLNQNTSTLIKENDNNTYVHYSNEKDKLKKIKRLNKIKTRKQ